MSLGDIKNKIIADANQKKDELLKQALVKKEEVLGEYKKKAKEYTDSLYAIAESDGTGLKRGIVIDAKLKLKNETLRKKREILEGIFNEAQKRIIDSHDYADWVKNWVKRASITKNEEIILSRNEGRLDQGWLDNLNREIGGGLRFASERGRFSGGVILKDGEVFSNITIETLMKEYKEELEKSALSILF